MCAYHHASFFRQYRNFRAFVQYSYVGVLFIYLPSFRSITFSSPSPRALRLVLVESTVSLVLWAEGSQLPPVSPLSCSSGNHDVPYIIASQTALKIP
jgi:hypothetical protein